MTPKPSYSEGRSRQLSIRAGYRSLIGHNGIYLSELRELVERTKDWPGTTRVRVEKGSLTGDQIKVTDTRQDWTN